MKVFIGYEPREKDGYSVTLDSIMGHNETAECHPVDLLDCRRKGLYSRPTVTKDGQLFDVISNAPMATEFAISRFLVQWLPANSGQQWALFMDCDMLVRCDLDELLELAEDKYAVMCVKHDIDHGTGQKMDGCEQTSYPRKNWSSVLLWNLAHPANRRLTLDWTNALPGRKLHQLCWLRDDEIGNLDPEWNHLVGLCPENPDAKIVHFTRGLPSMPGYENCEHSDEWRDYNGDHR